MTKRSPGGKKNKYPQGGGQGKSDNFSAAKAIALPKLREIAKEWSPPQGDTAPVREELGLVRKGSGPGWKERRERGEQKILPRFCSLVTKGLGDHGERNENQEKTVKGTELHPPRTRDGRGREEIGSDNRTLLFAPVLERVGGKEKEGQMNACHADCVSYFTSEREERKKPKEGKREISTCLLLNKQKGSKRKKR